MGEARRLWIEGPAGRLEGMLRLAPASAGAVLLAHPHPLYGGTLHNPVLFHADRELNRSGLVTLRIHFRGVGASDGRFDEGRGELEDLEAAWRWLRGLAGPSPAFLVGYSFGAWCAARLAAQRQTPAGLVTLGLPVRTYAWEGILGGLRAPWAVVQGEGDELGSPPQVRALLERTGAKAQLVVVPGADHLFTGRAREAGLRVAEIVQRWRRQGL